MNRVKSLLFVFLALTLFISGCSKYKLYSMAINNSRNKAGLSLKKATISIGDIIYMDNAVGTSAPADKEIILMVHGFGANKDNWIRFADRLADDYRIISLDLPGHGESASDLSVSYTIANQAMWLNEFTDVLQIKKAHIIGSSMGGAISVKFTHEYPEKVLSMTLMNSAGVYKTESEYTKLLKQGINPLVVATPDEYKKLVNFVMETKPYIPGSIIAVLTEKKIARKAMDEKIFQDIVNDINTTADLLPEIHTPSLIIWGDHDRVLHVDNAEEFHQKIPGSEIIVLEDIGHLPMLETPKKSGDLYARFLSSCREKI
jgi:pimeloyl-ACP methyl ester carboxylesterase